MNTVWNEFKKKNNRNQNRKRRHWKYQINRIHVGIVRGKVRMTFHLHQKNPVLRKGDEIYQGIYWLIVQASLVPLLSYTKCWEQLHPSLSAVISQTSGKSDKKHDERPVAGERLTGIIVHRYPKRKNSRNRNKLRAKSISSSYRRARFSLFNPAARIALDEYNG